MRGRSVAVRVSMGIPRCAVLSIHLHPCKGGPPPSTLSWMEVDGKNSTTATNPVSVRKRSPSTHSASSAFPLAAVLGDRRPPGTGFLPGRGNYWFPASAEVSQASAKMQDSRCMNLRDPGFYDTKDEPNLFHGRFFLVVKGHNQTLTFGQAADCARQPLPHFRVEITKERIVLGPVRKIDQLLFTRIL